MERDYQLVERLSKLGDDVLVGVEEVAAFTGFAQITIQQRQIKGAPEPIPGPRRLRWRLGAWRDWGRGNAQPQPQQQRKPKAAQTVTKAKKAST